METLTVVGGIYRESCVEPDTENLFGSGLRAAIALSQRDFDVQIIGCVGKDDLQAAISICDNFGIRPILQTIEETVTFEYYHPLSKPNFYGEKVPIKLPDVNAKSVLYYGMIDAEVCVHADYLVYDPQNHKPFVETGSSAKHLALVLNKSEAYNLSNLELTATLEEVGQSLLESQNAETVVIKNGSKGAIVFDKEGYTFIPLFKTKLVSKIGSGDIFSSVFAWQWAIVGGSAYESAMIASRFTATYCQSNQLPLPEKPENFEPINNSKRSKQIYLIAASGSMGQRWLESEFRAALIDFGNKVVDYSEGVIVDLEKIDIVLAVLNDSNSKILAEIDSAISNKKQVVIFLENDIGQLLSKKYSTSCSVVSDFSTAVYMTSW